MSIEQEEKAVVELYYPHDYLVEEDEVGESGPQDTLGHYLKQVLEYYYRRERWLIMANRDHHHSAIQNRVNLIVPDLSVLAGISIPLEEQPYIDKWDMRPDRDNRPPPPLVIEIASQTTFDKDIGSGPDDKPRLYGQIGVKEYFCYDPNDPRLFPPEYASRLIGWRYDEEGQPHRIEPDERGWLWSEVLQGWLGEDGLYLRLYDLNGQRQLTGVEAAELEAGIRRQEEVARRKAELKAQREAAARQKAEIEARQAELEAQKEATARQEAERQVEELRRQLEEMKRQQEGRGENDRNEPGI